MAIENTYLLGKNITLGCGFDLQAKAPLDSRQTVPTFEGLRALIIGDAAYEGMIVYDEGTKKTYQAQKCEPYSVVVDEKTKTYDIAFREFGLTDEELKALIASETTAAMEFKGATATLPVNPAKGDMWKVTASFEVAGETTKVGDSIVYNGEEWFRIPSGDDIEDTWRPVTGVDNDSTLTFAAGDKLDVEVAANGTVTYSHEEIAAPTVKKVGDDEGDEPTRTYIASIETDGYGHITGYKTATEVVEDTNTTYTFEGQSDEATSVYFQVTSSDAEAAEVIYLDAYSKNEANGKFVEKVTGKQLSTEDFTTALLNKLNGIADEANKYVHAEHTAYAEGLYKVTVDAEGHVSNATAVTKQDIVDLGIPGQDTTYEKATVDADGLMSKEHFAKVEGIYAGATKVENVGGGKIKINDQEVTVYAHPDKHAIADVDGLQDALNNKIGTDNKDNYDAAYAHSLVDHAPANAQENVIESVKVNGTALEIKDKAVDITVPTGALANKSEVAKTDLAQALVNEIDGKVASVTAGDNSIFMDGDATDPTIAVKISEAEGNALEVDTDGLKVIIPDYNTFDNIERISFGGAGRKGLVTDVSGIRWTETAEVFRTIDDEELGIADVITNFDLPIIAGDNVTLAVEDNFVKINVDSTKVETSETNGNIKVDGQEVTVYTHPDKHTISDVTGLQDVLDGLQAKGDYAAEEHTHTKSDITDFAHTHTKSEITDFAHNHTASEITDFAIEVAKVKVNEAVKATQDGNGKVIADTYAEKATTLAGYGIGDAYTKTEIEALLTWGSF